jgi:tripartite-type tricarboxylate transporter receptor subunit TctC
MRLARALVTIPALVSLALASIALTGARAQSYPGRPVRMIVPYPPAGANDLLARIVGEKLAAMWGQPVVVDNRPGANGLIGVEAAKNSAPDGYTLVMGATGTHAINPVLYRKLPYDAVKDFAPITLLGSAPIVFVVHPSVPVHSIKELVALSHATPGKLNYAAGASLFNLTMELFKSETGADITYVPYRGSVQALTALTSGEVQVVADVIQTPLPFIKDGRLRALAVTSRARAFAAPEIPTMIETGFADFEIGAWSGIYAPAGTPEAIVATIDAAIRKTLDAPDVLEKLHQVGYERVGLGPVGFAALMKREIAQYAKIVAEAHIPPLD